MSLDVPLPELRDVAAGYGPAAYVVAASGSGSPRILHSGVSWEDGDGAPVIRVRVGRSAGRAMAANPEVSLLWAATDREPMSLIVDGTVIEGPPADGGEARIRPTGAVRHRPAPD